MTARTFLDTNILLYALSTDPNEKQKAQIAKGLLATEDFGLSAQVCQEFFVAATGKLQRTIGRPQALALLDLLLQRPIIDTTPALITSAIRIQERFQLSYWDSAIISAATFLESRTLYSEDLNHGQFYGTVQVLNPFLTQPKS